MEQRISLVTLGVSDLKRSISFYERLGWKRAVREAKGVAFFQMGGLAFGLYPKDKLAQDAHLVPEGTGFGGITLAQNARGKEDVDRILAEAVAAGAKILKAAEDVFWGAIAVISLIPTAIPGRWLGIPDLKF